MFFVAISASLGWFHGALAQQLTTPDQPKLTTEQLILIAQKVCLEGLTSPTPISTEQAILGIGIGWQKVTESEGIGAVTFFFPGTANKEERGYALWGIAVAAHVGKVGARVADACFNRAFKYQVENSKPVTGQSLLLSDYGKFNLQTGHSDAALMVLAYAVQLDPNNAHAHDLLSKVYKTLKKPEEAAKHAARVKEIVANGYKPQRR